ncbi:hypothetical protein B0T14DRAFT_15920 [Immersiella caudata]|uniref:Uncharacterized protein n=1 Tax=Immersiella caudata TaxID=314043 RepID=A0AA39XDG6_9PEZI|nr:hypothetical protein B0T14DRAFT_15920 [Immersiella caudata]
MAAPLRPPSSRPEGAGDPYFEDQWSDGPTEDHDDAPRRRTRTHSMGPSRPRSSFIPGEGARGETVPYGRPTPHRADTEPFSPALGLRTRPYSGYYGPPPPSRTPFTPRQPYPNPADGYPNYSPGYGTGYTTAPPPETSPFSYPSTPADFGHTVPYPSSQSQPFGSPFNDGRSGVRGPTIRVRKTQVPAEPQPQPRPRQEDIDTDREADKQYWRERQRQKDRQAKEAQKREYEAEKRAIERLRREKLQLKVKKLQEELKHERNRAPSRSGFERNARPQDAVQELMDHLHTLRAQERERRLVAQPGSMTQLLQDIAEIAEARREQQASRDRLQLLGGFRPPTRSEYGNPNYESLQRKQIEEVLRDILGGLSDDDMTRLPLPARSYHTGRSASEDFHPEDDFRREAFRDMPREFQEEDAGASPRSRYRDALGNVNDLYGNPSSPQHRTGDPGPSIVRDPYPSPEPSRYAPSRYSTPSTPTLGRRQTAPTPILKVVPPSSSKRARGSDFSSDHSTPADHGEYSPYHDPRELRAEQYQEERAPRRMEQRREGLPRRTEQYRDELPRASEQFREEPQRMERPRPYTPATEPERPEIRRADSHRSFGTRRSSMSGPRSTIEHESPGLQRNRSRVAFREQDPAGGRPLLDDDEDASGSDSGGRPRGARSYRIAGDNVSDRRYNPRDGQAVTPPPAPPPPRSGTPIASERPGRSPRRVQVEEGWSDDEEIQDGRFMSRESTVGR